MHNIASENVYDNWRPWNMTNKNLMYFVQTQVETLPACESNFEKSDFQKCTFGDDLGSKNYIYNNMLFLH